MTFREEQIGDCRLILGDCLEILPTLGQVDAVVTDPPYTTPTAISFGRQVVRSISDLSIQATYMKLWASVVRPALRADAHVLVFCDDDYYPVLHTVFYEWPFRQMAVWDKGQIGLGRGFRRRHELIIHASPDTGNDFNTWSGTNSHASVLQFAPVPTDQRQHGAQKPLPLIEYLVKAGSPDGGLVVDSFMGSGTTGVACAKLGRRFIGIEIEPKYFEIACRRIEEAYRQPSLFKEAPRKAKQPSMFGGDAA